MVQVSQADEQRAAKAEASRKAAETAALVKSEHERFTQLYNKQILPEK